jgi:CHASE2 domain-containing sensor protein
VRPRRFAPRLAALGALAATLLGAAIGIVIVRAPLLQGLEQSTLAARFALRSDAPPAGVAVVAIDDRSFAMLQHPWPFPRSWDGRVLEQLHRAGARAVFFDVQFTEPTTPTQDGALFDALGQTGGATLATTETDGHGHSNVLGGDANLALVDSRAAASVFPVDQGGVIDRVPYELDRLPTAAVVVAQRLHKHAEARSLFGGDGAYIDYQGPPGTFPTLSFADILRGHFAPAAVRGKVIVIGATSPTLQDLHATPTASNELMSGAEIQANAIWTVLHGVPLRPAPDAVGIMLIMLASLMAPLVRFRRSVTAVAVATPLAAVTYLAGAQLAFDAGVVVPVVGPLAALGLSAAATLLASHLLVTCELHATQFEIVQRLGRAAEARDGATGRHLERMTVLCEQLAKAAGLPRRQARVLRRASALHDVGKIAIPDTILLHPGIFEPHERAIMTTHANLGAQMLAGSSTSLIQMAEILALTHHEHWDGTGYPAGLAGEDIPIEGRICAICDVFDALISRRRYKPGWTFEAAVAEIERGSGSHFDPRLTKLFLEIAPRLYRDLGSEVDDPGIPTPEPGDDPGNEPSSRSGATHPSGTHARSLALRRVGAASGEAREERDLGLMPGRQGLGADPDLLDDPAADLEDDSRGSTRRQVPIVQADAERAAELEMFAGGGDARAGADALDRIVGA